MLLKFRISPSGGGGGGGDFKTFWEAFHARVEVYQEEKEGKWKEKLRYITYRGYLEIPLFLKCVDLPLFWTC